ncbi:MAG: pilus assembly protein PilM [Planctomycetes bacterium]|nr:pilus assembly protein PilM [Planctomycetota bacterium]
MAKGVGLDPGEYEIKVVELDGSYKRPRLAKVSVDRVSQVSAAAVDEEHAHREAESALHALQDAKIARDNVTLGFPCREAVLRSLVVPFKGRDQIRKVIKFEVEDSIHSHNVDEMIVDFHTLEELEGQATRVLVAAVPKEPLRVTLRALESFGIDPEVVDLDTMALFRVAEWAGCFRSDSDAPAESTDVAVPGPKRAKVVIDVGGRSTRIVAVQNGRILDMRALRVGVDGVADDVAASKGVSLPQAREAVFEVFQSGQAFEFEPPEVETESDEENVETAIVPAEAAPPLTMGEVSAAATDLLRRVHRELMRFVASMKTLDGFDAVWVTGGGSFLPGLDAVLEDVFGCSPQPIPVLENLAHNLDEDEARWVEPRIAIAVGLALGSMGGVTPMQFRQEDLAFQRGFDRIKFPLSIACMLAVFLLFILGLQRNRQRLLIERDYGRLHKVELKQGGRRSEEFKKAEFYGYVNNLMNQNSRYSLSQLIERKEFQKLLDDVIDAPTFDRIGVIERYLSDYVKKQREATGVYQDLQLPSGFEVLSKFAEVIERIEDELGSFVICNLELNMDHRDPFLEFKVAIRGDGYRARFERMKTEFEAEFAKADSPFLDFKPSSKGEDPYEGAVPGAVNQVGILLKDIKR